MRLVLRFLIAPIMLVLCLAYVPEIFPDHGVLYRAIQDNDLNRLRTLLERGANPNMRTTLQSSFLWRWQRGERMTFTGTPLLLVALHYHRPEMAQLLLQYGADANVRDKYGNTALWHAVPLDEPSLIQALLDKGADPSVVMPQDKSTALREAPKPSPQFSDEDRDNLQLQRLLAEKSRLEYRARNPQTIRLLQEAEQRWRKQ